MEKKNTGLIVLVIILSVLVVTLSGYIVYNKVLFDDKTEDNNINNNDVTNNNSNTKEENVGFVNPDEHVEIEENIKLELIKIFNFVYDYHKSHFYGNYCVGDTDSNDRIEPPSGSVSMHKYNIASTEYSTFNEMIDYLKKYMTVNVIYSSEYMDSNYFIEKNGKLYCPFFETGKGGIGELEDVKIKYSKPWMNGYYATIERTLVFGDDRWSELYDVTFTQKNDTWVVSSYEMIL